MTPKYFDIHSHLNFKQYDADRDVLIAKMKEEGVLTNTVGVNLETSKEAVELAQMHENLFATIGFHPDDDKAGSFDEAEFAKLVTHPKVVAIGECGLDYAFMKRSDSGITDIEREKARQKKEFLKQIDFAIKYDKPLMIHCRDAYPDCLEILREKKNEVGDKLRGNFHFFTMSAQVAKECNDIGFSVSFTGPITFVSALVDSVKSVALENMMAETDAPFAAPAPYRGKRNEPAYVKYIVEKIAEIKGIDVARAQEALLDNSLRFFGIKIS